MYIMSITQFGFVMMIAVVAAVVVALAAGKMVLYHYFQENMAIVHSIY
jgi:hypothetical protein